MFCRYKKQAILIVFLLSKLINHLSLIIFFSYAVIKKSMLQSYTLRAYGTFPTYHVRTEGEPHDMYFECTVHVQSHKFVSATRHRRRKDAEEDASDVAYTALMGNETLETLLGLLNKVSIITIFFCDLKASDTHALIATKHHHLMCVNLYSDLELKSIFYACPTYANPYSNSIVANFDGMHKICLSDLFD